MRHVEPLSEDGLSFAIHYADTTVARWLVDPKLPWVLVAQHTLAEGAWHSLTLPLSIPGYPMAKRRVCNLRMDLLLRTDEFIAAAADIGASGQGGLLLWQLEREPRAGLSFDLEAAPPQAFRQMYQGLGIHLSFDLPHRGETAVAYGPDAATVRAAWLRVCAAPAE